MSLRFETSELRRFAAQTRTADRTARAQLRQGVLAAGNLVAGAARSRAAFSSRIPGSITVKPGAVSATVYAGGAAAPDAAPLDHQGQGGSFRHPVFGQKDVSWVSQEARPFLEPALIEQADAAADLIADSVVEGLLAAVI